MAHDITRWVVGLIVVAGAYLMLRVSEGMSGNFGRPPMRAESAERARALALAEEWRGLERQRAFLGYREALRGELAHRARAEEPSVALRLDLPDSLRDRWEPALRSGLTEAWQALGLGVSKVSVGMVVVSRSDPAEGGTQPGFRGSLTGHLLPDSLEPRSCLSVLSVSSGWFKWQEREGIGAAMRRQLGPCAFLARFGVPGPRVRGWLGARGYDVAMTPWAGRNPLERWEAQMAAEAQWQWVYGLSPAALGCSAGRAPDCRRVIRRGDGAGAARAPSLIAERPGWRLETLAFLGAGGFLAAVLEQAGPERFSEFWVTELPVDSALTIALGEPVGEWLSRRHREQYPTIRLGPAIPVRAAAQNLAMIAGALGVAVMLGRWRRVA